MARVSKEREELLTRVVGIKTDYGLFSLVNNECKGDREVSYMLHFLNSHPEAGQEEITGEVASMRLALAK